MGVTLTRLLRPAMCRHQGVVLGVDAHLATAATDPQTLTDQAERGGVVGIVEGQMAIAVQRDQFPGRQVVGGLGKRTEVRLLGLLKAQQGWLSGGAMDALSGGGQTPLTNILVGLRERGGCATPEEIARDIVHAALFDLAFVLGRARATGSDEEAVMLGTLAVALLDLGVIPGSLGNASLEIVDHQALRHTAEKFKGMAMEQQPGANLLVEDKLDILVATPGEGHDKAPGFAQLAGGRIEHASGRAKVDLGFLTGSAFNADDDIRTMGVEGPNKAVDSGIAASEAAFVEALPNGGDLGALGA